MMRIAMTRRKPDLSEIRSGPYSYGGMLRNPEDTGLYAGYRLL